MPKPKTIEEARVLRDRAITQANATYERRVAELQNPQPPRQELLRQHYQARREQAIKLRRDGKTYKEIGEVFGVSASQALVVVCQALKDEVLKTLPPEPGWNCKDPDNENYWKWQDELDRRRDAEWEKIDQSIKQIRDKETARGRGTASPRAAHRSLDRGTAKPA